jgi:hypothetical protein
MDAAQTLPKGFCAGLAIAFSAQEPADAGNLRITSFKAGLGSPSSMSGVIDMTA